MSKYYPEAYIHYGFSDDLNYSPTILGHKPEIFGDSQNINSTMYDATYNHFTSKYKSLSARGPEYRPSIEAYGMDSSEGYMNDYQARHKSTMCGNNLSGIQECMARAKDHHSSSARRSGLSKIESDTVAKVQSKYTSRYDDLRAELYNQRISTLQPSRLTESSITQDITDSNTLNYRYIKRFSNPTRASIRTNTHMRFTEQYMD